MIRMTRRESLFSMGKAIAALALAPFVMPVRPKLPILDQLDRDGIVVGEAVGHSIAPTVLEVLLPEDYELIDFSYVQLPVQPLTRVEAERYVKANRRAH